MFSGLVSYFYFLYLLYKQMLSQLIEACYFMPLLCISRVIK